MNFDFCIINLFGKIFISNLYFPYNVMVEEKFDEYGNKIINETGSVTFKCPKCSKVEISRSRKARELSKEYVCPRCGFVGP